MKTYIYLSGEKITTIDTGKGANKLKAVKKSPGPKNARNTKEE